MESTYKFGKLNAYALPPRVLILFEAFPHVPTLFKRRGTICGYKTRLIIIGYSPVMMSFFDKRN
ncbi:MAG: hypothetical protein GX488_10270 [Clostridiales bacterium]|nr:hypothetical protein [Clostridiales bacterium]